jgi:isoquinoline 1-oxidoreductase subunit alpha
VLAPVHLVHLDDRAIRSCVTPVAHAIDKNVTTIEAIGETPIGRKVQRAWLDLEVVQCGYCQSGQIMSAALGLELPASSAARFAATVNSIKNRFPQHMSSLDVL